MERKKFPQFNLGIEEEDDSKKNYFPLVSKKINSNYMNNQPAYYINPIFYFIDPYQTYRMAGDLIISNKLFHKTSDPIYTLELYLNYKAIRQIHKRENGIIFELEDYAEKELANVGLLSSRMASLGNKMAIEVSNFLLSYSEYMTSHDNFAPPKETSDNEEQTSSSKPFDWIDSIFQNHVEDFVFLRGSKLITNRDSRIKLLCFNNKLLQCITKEDNFFSNEFLSNCFHIFELENMEEFSKLLQSNVIGKEEKNKPKVVMKKFNTLIGKIELGVEVNTYFMPKEKIFFHYYVHSKPLTSIFEKINRSTKISLEKSNKKTLKDRNISTNYSALMKSYYLKK